MIFHADVCTTHCYSASLYSKQVPTMWSTICCAWHIKSSRSCDHFSPSLYYVVESLDTTLCKLSTLSSPLSSSFSVLICMHAATTVILWHWFVSPATDRFIHFDARPLSQFVYRSSSPHWHKTTNSYIHRWLGRCLCFVSRTICMILHMIYRQSVLFVVLGFASLVPSLAPTAGMEGKILRVALVEARKWMFAKATSAWKSYKMMKETFLVHSHYVTTL